MKVLLQTLLLILALGLPTSLLIYSKIQQVATLQPQGADLSRKVDVGLRRVTGFASPIEAEQEAWAASRDQLVAKLPPNDELPRLVKALTLLADRSQVADLLITTSPRVPLRKDAESPMIGEAALVKAQAGLGVDIGYYPIKIAFRSGYRDMARFLDGIEQLTPLVTVASMEVGRGLPKLGVWMVLRAYHSGSVRNGTG